MLMNRCICLCSFPLWRKDSTNKFHTLILFFQYFPVAIDDCSISPLIILYCNYYFVTLHIGGEGCAFPCIYDKTIKFIYNVQNKDLWRTTFGQC